MIKTPMMLLVGDQEIDDYELIKKQLDGIKRTGFDAVCLEFRCCRYNELDQKGQETIKFVGDYTKSIGLKFVKIIPHFLTEQLNRHPHLKNTIIRKVEVHIANGKIRRKDLFYNGKSPLKIVAVFQICCSVGRKYLEKNNLEEIGINSLPLFCKKLPDGDYAFYCTYEQISVDYSSEESHIIVEELMETLHDVEVDGYAMDEFGAGSRLEGNYLYSESFRKKFQQKYGYRFEDVLHLIDYEGKNENDFTFAKVRYDYYALTEEVTYNYQKLVKELFCKKYGDDLFIGFHHTWVGEGNSGDLWAGDIDYFHHADNLSGGFVDAQYDSERTMNSLGLFAESIAKYQEKPAYNMCWDRYTTPLKFDYFHRLLAVRNINWVGHAVSKTAAELEHKANCFIPFAENGKEWGNIGLGNSRKAVFSDFIGNANWSANVAIIYSWESCAFFNNDYMHYHRLSIKALADKLILNNIPVEIIPSNQEHLEDFDVIFIPWGCIMHETLWRYVRENRNKKQRIIFFGPPPTILTDGKDIRREFYDLLKIDSLEERVFCGGYECYIWDLWFNKNKIPMRLYADKKNITEFHVENISYYAFELPLTDAFFSVLNELQKYSIFPTGKAIAKQYTNGEEMILTVTARWDSLINDDFVFDGNQIKIENGELFGIKSIRGTIKEVVSVNKSTVFINGKRFMFSSID